MNRQRAPTSPARVERPILPAWLTKDVVGRAGLTAIATLNVVLVAVTLIGFFVSDAGYDWLIFREAGRRVVEGDLYRWEGQYAWSYSPLLAYVFAVLAPIGFLGWSVLHVAALGVLRERWLAGLALVSFPFWADVYNGNTMVFVFVAAVGAWRRSTPATVVYLVLCLLMPRPVMFPLLGWILWKLPAWRLRFAAMTLVSVLAVLATGYGQAWIQALVTVPSAVAASSRDFGPAILLGTWWTPLGLALASVLTLRGRLGWASLAASPYWLPQYLLMLFLEVVPPRVRRLGGAPKRVTSRPPAPH